MKTIKKGIEVKRVKDKEAMQFVRNGWSYCPKSEFKTKKKEEEK